MLSLALIVKNEEKNLARCLDSAQELWDELVIIDTGSTDKTVEIAKTYTQNVYHFTWVNDFSKARNFAFSKCTKPWIMWLDADDILKPFDVKRIRDHFDVHSKADIIDYFLINYHYWVNPPTADGVALATQLRERIIRATKARWVGRCHEHIMVDWLRSHAIPDAAVWHLRDEEDRKADGNRNIKLMQLEIADSPSSRNHFYLGNEYAAVGQTKEAIESYKKAYDMNDNLDTRFQAAYQIAQKSHHLDQEEAIRWYQIALNVNTQYREPLLGLADIYLAKKDLSKAAFWLESALNVVEPANPVMIVLKENYTFAPHNALAKVYFGLKQYKKAIEASEKVYECTRQQQILSDINLSKVALKETYKRPSGTTRLNLGSGGKTIPGFTNCDLFAQPGVDELFSLDEVPYADKSVDEISSEHALEHLPRPRAEAAIKEWARVLKPGGKLTLKVPDLEDCCRFFLERPQLQDSWYMHTIYGVQDHRDTKDAPFKDKVNYGQIHYTGFTKSRLSKLLTEAGFIVDKIENYDGWDTPSIAVEAHIPSIPAESLKKIAFINNTLFPKYLSYGDYWEDAFKATGHHVEVFKYNNIDKLPEGYDLYFFLEANKRYNVEAIPEHARPRVLYTLEPANSDEILYFDLIATGNRTAEYQDLGLNVVTLPNHSHAQQVKKLLEMRIGGTIKKSQSQEVAKNKKVDIVIPSYKNASYLKLAIEAVRRNTEDYNLIIVNSGDDQETRDYLKSETGIKFIDFLERKTFSQAVNIGLKATTNDVIVLNNDTIVGKDWLEAYRRTLKTIPFDIVNPFSNCDAGWIHDLHPVVGGKVLKPDMVVGDVDLEALYNFSSPEGGVVERPWVAFYATYIKRKVIDAVGYLDENFLNGGEDYDYCRRAVKQGFKCGHAFSSWVFHFGGKTRKVSEADNYNKHHEEDKANNEFMKFKDRETVAIYTGPAYEKWDIATLNTTGIGGSETCAAMLADNLAKLGYRVIIIGDCEEKIINGVEYIPYQRFDCFKENNYVDYFISSRTIIPLNNKIKNRLNLVWVHDIWLSSQKSLGDISKVDKFVCLSPWHIDFFSNHHNISKDKIILQDNGFDHSLYVRHIEKDPYRLIYSSSPDRGLDTLLELFPSWKKKFPKLNLHVFYGFDNWKKALQHRNSPQEIALLNKILKLMEQEGVYYHGRVPQNQLAEEQKKASLWVYPTNFWETWCITAVQAMAAGAIPVATNLAALSTTIPDGCGIKVSSSEECYVAVEKLLTNPELQIPYRIAGKQRAAVFDWPIIAKQWQKLFTTLGKKNG